MTTLDLTPDADTPSLAAMLESADRAVRRLQRRTPVLVRLAVAFNGFFVIRLVSIALERHASPFRDAYGLSIDWAAEAVETIDVDYFMTTMIRRQCPLRTDVAKLTKIETKAQMELHFSTDDDVELISNRILSLALSLRRCLELIAGDETALPQPRASARRSGELAYAIWAHYGGDGGGW